MNINNIHNNLNPNTAVNKIPVIIAHPQTISSINKVKNTIVITYENQKHFEDGDTSLKELRTLTLTYKRTIKSFDVEIDDQDNLIVIAQFKTPRTFFGWTLNKEGE